MSNFWAVSNLGPTEEGKRARLPLNSPSITFTPEQSKYQSHVSHFAHFNDIAACFVTASLMLIGIYNNTTASTFA